MSTARKAPPKKLIRCSVCNHEQMEYAEASASACEACGAYIRLSPSRRRRRLKATASLPRREVQCFQCNHMENVPPNIPAWQCSACGAKVDLSDHTITKGCSHNIFTYGAILISPSGHFSGSRAEAQWMEIAGTASGMLVSKSRIVINGHGRLRGNASGKHLEVEPGAILEARQPLEFETALIKGKATVKQLCVTKELRVTSIGELEAGSFQFSSALVEPGGILRGNGTCLKLPSKTKTEPPNNNATFNG